MCFFGSKTCSAFRLKLYIGSPPRFGFNLDRPPVLIK